MAKTSKKMERGPFYPRNKKPSRGGRKMQHAVPFTLINRGPVQVELKYMEGGSQMYAKVMIGNRWARTPIFAAEEHGQILLYVLDLLGFEAKVVQGVWDEEGDEDYEDDTQ